MDDETARWARVAAARLDTSLSKFVGELLRRSMRDEQLYEAAHRSYRGRAAADVSGGRRYPARDDLYDR
jgi:hypothetical protein